MTLGELGDMCEQMRLQGAAAELPVRFAFEGWHTADGLGELRSVVGRTAEVLLICSVAPAQAPVPAEQQG